MKTYKYIAKDLYGQRKEALANAGSLNDVLAWLGDNNLTPISVDEITTAAKPKSSLFRRKRVKSSQLANLCWQLNTMVEGGITIASALETISADTDNVYLQHVLAKVLENINKGLTFSESIAEFPDVFNEISCAIILAGESGGNMQLALFRLAQYFDNRDKLAKKIKTALAYPLFVFGFITMMVVFIMAFIIPKFRVIFDQIGGKLPPFTRAFMYFYDTLRFNLPYILVLAFIAVFTAITLYKKNAKVHYFFSKLALSIPLIGNLMKLAFITLLCKTTSTLLAAGVPVLDVFDILAAMTKNDIIKNTLIKTKESIVEGSNISLAMAETEFFPNLVVKMVQVGEQSGSIVKVLDRTAEYYDRKVDSTISTLMPLLEPLMIISVGGIVLVVVLALYLPVFSLSEISK